MLPQVSKIDPLPSLAVSRRAHEWTELPHQAQSLLQTTELGGMALLPKEWLQFYVTRKQDNRIFLIRFNLESESDEAASTETLLDYSQYTARPGPLVVDDQDRVYLAIDDGLLIVHDKAIVGRLELPLEGSPIVSMTLGSDRFLYLATARSLYRMRLRVGPMKVPDNLVIT